MSHSYVEIRASGKNRHINNISSLCKKLIDEGNPRKAYEDLGLSKSTLDDDIPHLDNFEKKKGEFFLRLEFWCDGTL